VKYNQHVVLILKYKSLDEYLFANNIDPNKPQKIEFDISDKKTQCEAIGFKPETEKFADCVLRLVELGCKTTNSKSNNCCSK
jgi:hypothetical protein